MKDSAPPGNGLAGTRVLPELAGNINRLPNRQPSHPALPKSYELTSRALGDLCLHHLAENPAQLAEFMTMTGYSPDALRKAVGGDALDRGMIDYFATSEALLLALCANNSFKPDDFMRVWAKLNPAG
jgi:hypothetical protein